jgi:glyoxylase-like metal-dependent hydrolase (beta-lactamase superfamily II)
MDVVDLRPDLRFLRGVPGQAYLLRHGGGVTLIDTGQVGQGEIVAAALRDWGLDRDSLTCVVLTHWHADHAGSAAEIAEWPRVRVLAHKADAPVIRGTAVGAPPAFTPAEEALHAVVARNLPDAPPSRVDRELDDQELIAEIGARVISTPGHTDGSIALHFPDADVLFTGDIAAEHEGHVILGPFNVDRDLARQSFRLLANVTASAVCFGHGQLLLGQDADALRVAASEESLPDPLG